jgi:hypothetical protein
MTHGTPLVLTVHGINSDGEWQADARRALDPHCKYAAYQHRDYRYWGFALQIFSPVPALIALIGAGAALTPVELAADLSAWGLVIGAFVPGALALTALKLSLAAAIRPSNEPPTRTTFLVLLAIGAIVLAAGPLVPRSERVFWAWPGVIGIGILLGGLLEAWGDLPLVNTAKTWAIPVGAGLVAFAVGTALRRFVEHGLVALGLPAGRVLLRTIFGGLAAIAVSSALIRAPARRRGAVENLRKWIVEQYIQHQVQSQTDRIDVHLVAHSFGTYLVGAALEDWTQQATRTKELPVGTRPVFRTVVLVGSAIRADYPWDKIIGSGIVDQVRNEVGGRDAVIRVAGLSFDFAPFAWLGWHWQPFKMLGLGAAGYTGFRGPEKAIHDVRNSLEFCEQCRIRDERKRSRVHNVWLPTFRHSDAVQTTERAGRFWLPLVLGFEPWEYWDFRRLCSQIEAYADVKLGLGHEVDTLEAQLVLQLREYRKAVDEPLGERDAQAEIVRLESVLNETRNKIEEAEARGRAVIAQLEQRAWDWTYLDNRRETLLFYLANQLQDAWFMKEASPSQDRDQSRAIKWVAARRAEEIMPHVVRLSVQAAQTLREVEQRPRSRHTSLSDEENQALACLDPRTAVALAVKAAPEPSPSERADALSKSRPPHSSA